MNANCVFPKASSLAELRRFIAIDLSQLQLTIYIEL